MALRPFIIDTSDDRCKYLFDKLKAKGFRVREKAGWETDTYEVCILVFSPSQVIEKSDVEKLKKGSAVFGGNADLEAKQFMSLNGIAYFNILQDERFTVKNTVPTALGCIYKVMESSSVCINEMKTLVLGYGRVAKTLVKYLMGLDTKTFVYTIDEKERAMAEVFSQGTVNSLSEIGEYDLIINTVPAKLIDKRAMDSISKNAVVCDLASGSYVDIAALKEMGIKAMQTSALPGKIAPESAAGYMEDCILDTLNKNSGLKAVFLVR